MALLIIFVLGIVAGVLAYGFCKRHGIGKFVRTIAGVFVGCMAAGTLAIIFSAGGKSADMGAHALRGAVSSQDALRSDQRPVARPSPADEPADEDDGDAFARSVAKLHPNIVRAMRNTWSEPHVTVIEIMENSAWSEASLITSYANDAVDILREGTENGALSKKDRFRFVFYTLSTDKAQYSVLFVEISPQQLAELNLSPFAMSAGRFFDAVDTKSSGAFGARVLRSFCEKNTEDAPITCQRFG